MVAKGKRAKDSRKRAKPALKVKPASKRRAAAPETKPAAQGPARKAATPTRRTMPVHALGDERVHLAIEHRGRLRQGHLKTLCGLQAVSALSPFALADDTLKRCRVCFGKVDKDGLLTG